MRPRTLFLSLVAVFVVHVLVLAFPAFASKRRAVRTPAPDCSYSVSVAFGDPVPDGGMSRGRINVATLTSGNCGGWGAYSETSWIAVEAEPFSSTPAAYVTIAPNSDSQPRTGVVRIAGTPITITQLGRTEPPEVNLLANGKFNVDLANWGWQDRFPNGNGDATWSSLDASNAMASGSMHLRDDLTTGPAFQRMQCVNTPAGTYDYGYTARVANRDAAQPVIAFVPFEGANCTGNYPAYSAKTLKLGQNGVWTALSYTATLDSQYQSVGIIVAGWARQTGMQDVWIDDVFLKPR